MAAPPSALFPLPRAVAGIVVDKEYPLPDLVFGQFILPRRHGRELRGGLGGQARPALDHPPENIRLGKLGDGVGPGKGQRGGVERVGVVAASVQLCAVAEKAIGEIYLPAFPYRLSEEGRGFGLKAPQGAYKGVQVTAFTVRPQPRRRGRVDGAEKRGRLATRLDEGICKNAGGYRY